MASNGGVGSIAVICQQQECDQNKQDERRDFDEERVPTKLLKMRRGCTTCLGRGGASDEDVVHSEEDTQHGQTEDRGYVGGNVHIRADENHSNCKSIEKNKGKMTNQVSAESHFGSASEGYHEAEGGVGEERVT